MTRRAILATALAAPAFPSFAAQAEDPLQGLLSEWLRLQELMNTGVSDEVCDQLCERANEFADQIVDATPSSIAGARAQVEMVLFETEEGLYWDRHPEALRSALNFLAAVE
ncbi:MAG: hypothetical protein AAGI09_05500 [Pseudomonadota bacterium]